MNRAVRSRAAGLATFVTLAFTLASGYAAPESASALPVAPVARSTPVDFATEILPFLRESCLACHNQTKAKADLILETPQTILKGGESGPAAVPGKPEESLIFRAAAHFEKPFMPPKDNKANAPDLTAAQLGLLKLWIEQGARGEVRGDQKIAWQPLGSNVRPILSLAVSADDRFAAFGKGNELFVYDVRAGRCIGPLSDPALAGVTGAQSAAHLDLIEAVDMSPDGELLASGSFREVKIWRKRYNASVPAVFSKDASVLDSAGEKVLVHRNGILELWSVDGGKPEISFAPNGGGILQARLSADATHVAARSKTELRAWNMARPNVSYTAALEESEAKLSWAGENLLTVSGAQIRVWSLPSGERTNLVSARTIDLPEPAAFLETAYSNQVAVANDHGTIRLWNLPSGANVRTFTNASPPAAIQASPDGKLLAVAGRDGAIRIFGLAEARMLHEFRGDYRSHFGLRQTERALAFAKAVLVYRRSEADGREKERHSQIERVRKATEAAANAEKNFAEKEKQLAALKTDQAAADKALSELGAELKRLRDGADAAEGEVAKAKARIKEQAAKALEARLAAQAAELRQEIEKALAAALAQTPAPPEKPVAQGKSDPLLNDKMLEDLAAKAAAAALAKEKLAGQKPELETKIKAAEERQKAGQQAVAEAEKALKPLQIAKTAAENELQFAITGAQKSFDGLADAQNALQIAESDVKRLESAHDLAQKRLSSNSWNTRQLAFSPDGKMLAAARADGQVTLWKAETGELLDTIAGMSNATAMAFAGTDRLLFVSETEARFSFMAPLWKLDHVIGSAAGDSPFADRVNAVRFSPDGQFLATGGGEPSRSGELKIWRLRDFQVEHDLKNLHSDVVLALAWSPDGRLLASGAADRFAKVTETAGARIIRTLEGHTHHVLGVAWKRDGHTLMTAGADNVVKVWDAFSGEKKKNIDGFNKEVTSVAFIADSDQAIACSGDNTVRLIRENGEKIRAFEGATDFLQSAATAADGKFIVAGGHDGVLRIWAVDSGKLLAAWPGR